MRHCMTSKNKIKMRYCTLKNTKIAQKTTLISECYWYKKNKE